METPTQLPEPIAKAAPDKAKLLEFAKAINHIFLPELKSEEAKNILAEAKKKLIELSNFIQEKANEI